MSHRNQFCSLSVPIAMQVEVADVSPPLIETGGSAAADPTTRMIEFAGATEISFITDNPSPPLPSDREPLLPTALDAVWEELLCTPGGSHCVGG